MKSGFEKKVAKWLDHKNVRYEYEKTKLKYTVPESVHTYVADFTLPNGIIVESKGLFDRASRKKMALLTAQHPELDIRMLFMRDNKIAKNSKTRYSDFCKKNNIKYAVSSLGHVPDSWLLETKEETPNE